MRLPGRRGFATWDFREHRRKTIGNRAGQKRRNFRNAAIDDAPAIGKIASMTSTVTTNGHTVVPKQLRDRFKIKPGTTLDWPEDGNSIRVVKRLMNWLLAHEWRAVYPAS